MKLSCHCNITNPETWGYPYLESIKSFMDLCDEVIVVNGACNPITKETQDDGSVDKIKALDPLGNKIRVINMYWNDLDWSWEELGYHLQKGFEECSGDWVFKFDVDYIFHEDKIDYLRSFLSIQDSLVIPPKAIAIRKYNVMTADYYLPKSEIPLIVNKNFYKNLCYGRAYSEDKDFMCVVDKKEQVNGIFLGESILNQPQMIAQADAHIWCYDFTFMTQEIVEKIRQISYVAQHKFENPYMDEKQIQGLKDIAFGKLRKIMLSRSEKQLEKIDINRHPKIIQDKVKSITKDMFGYNMFGWLNQKYVKK